MSWSLGVLISYLSHHLESSHFDSCFNQDFLFGIKSGQLAEIITLTRACHLGKKAANIYTECHCAFGVVHVHFILWKKGFLTSSI
jgi:hypothetical protein